MSTTLAEFEEHILVKLEEITQHVLQFLPIKSLHTSARVCKTWAKVVARLRKQRLNHVQWLVHDNRADDLEDQVTKHLKNLWTEPQIALLFCATEMWEEMLRVSCPARDGQRLSRAAKAERISVDDYFHRYLPPDCQFCSVTTDGVIGTSPDGKRCQEFESAQAFSCLLLPRTSKVRVHQFYLYPSIEETFGSRYIPTTDTPEPTAAAIERVTGIPPETNVKLILYFSSDFSSDQNSNVDFTAALIKHYKRVVVAGGCVDGFVPDGCTDEEEPYGMGIAFSGDQVKVASVVLTHEDGTKEKMKTQLDKLLSAHIPASNRVAFMFSCCGRGSYFHHAANVESQLFRQLFPNTPLFGFFGNGELGYEYLPDYSIPDQLNGIDMTTKRHPDPENGYVWDLPDTTYAYSSVFVLCSFGED